MRHIRRLQSGACYHVTARINNRELLFERRKAKELFERVIVRAKSKYSFTIENFVIMGNHIHFIIRPALVENLSRIMQWILSVFALSFNKREGRCGHVWGERFFSRIIQNRSQYTEISTYIDENPVKAGLVSAAWKWRFCGCGHTWRGMNYLIAHTPLEDLFPESL